MQIDAFFLTKSCYTDFMNTVYKIPVSKLPAELRGDFSGDTVVKVTVASENEVVAGFTKAELDKELSQSFKDKEAGLGTRLSSPTDIKSFFTDIKAEVHAKYKTS